MIPSFTSPVTAHFQLNSFILVSGPLARFLQAITLRSRNKALYTENHRNHYNFRKHILKYF